MFIHNYSSSTYIPHTHHFYLSSASPSILLHYPTVYPRTPPLSLIRMSIRTSLSPTYTHTSITSASHSYVHPHFSITHLYTHQHHICISFVCPSTLLYHPPIHTLASHLHLIRMSIRTSLSPTYTHTSITSASHSYVHPYFSITHLYTHQHHICISFVCPSVLLYHPPIHTLASHLHLIRMSIHTSLSPTYTHTSITSASHSYVHPHFSITHLYTHQHHICISFVCPSVLLYHPPIHTLASHLHLIRMSIHTSLSPTYTHTSITSASHSYVHPHFSITHLYTDQHHICISFVCPSTLLYHPPIHTLASHLHLIRMSIHTSLSPTYTHTSITSASHSYVHPHFSITHLYTHQHHICISFVCPSTLLYHPPIHRLASHLHLIRMSIHTSLSPTYTHTRITPASHSYVQTHFSITHLYTHQHHICILFVCPSTLLYHPPIHTLASHLHLIRMSIHTSLSPTYTHTSITSASHSYVHPYFSITHLYTHQHHICISFVCPSTLLYHPPIHRLASHLHLIRMSIRTSLSPTYTHTSITSASHSYVHPHFSITHLYTHQHHICISFVCPSTLLYHPPIHRLASHLHLIRMSIRTSLSPTYTHTSITSASHSYVHPHFSITHLYTHQHHICISFVCPSTLLYHPPIHTLASHLHLIHMSIHTSLSPTYTHTSITSASHSYVHPHFSITHLYTHQHHICISFVCPSVLLYHPPIHTLASHLHLIRMSIHTSLSPTYTQTSITSASHSYVHPYFSITHLYTHQHHICISFVCPSTLLYHPPIHRLASHLHLIRMSIRTSLSPTYTHTSITSASHSYVHPHFSITHLYTHQHHICISFVCPSTLLYHPPIHTLASHLHLIRMSIHTSLSPTYTHTSITSASHSYVHPHFSITHLYTHQHHICISFVCPSTLLYHPPIHTLASHLHLIRMSIRTSLSPTYTHTSITSASHSYVQPHFSITHLYTHQHHICILFVCPSTLLYHPPIHTLLYHPPIHTLASHLHLIRMSNHTSLSPTYTHTSITSASHSYVHPHFSITHLYTQQHHICISFVCPSTLLYHPPIHRLASHLHLIRMSIHTSLSPTYTHTSITSASHSYVHPHFSITHLYTHQHHICILFVCPSTLLYHPPIHTLASHLHLIRMSIHTSLSPTYTQTSITSASHSYVHPHFSITHLYTHQNHICISFVCPNTLLYHPPIHTLASHLHLIRMSIHTSLSPTYTHTSITSASHSYVHPHFSITHLYTHQHHICISFVCPSVLLYHPPIHTLAAHLHLIRMSIHTSLSPTYTQTSITSASHSYVHPYFSITHLCTHQHHICISFVCPSTLLYHPPIHTLASHLHLIRMSIHTSLSPTYTQTSITSASHSYVHPYFSITHLYTHQHHICISFVCPSTLLYHPPIHTLASHLHLIRMSIHTSLSPTYTHTSITSASYSYVHPHFSITHLYTHQHHICISFVCPSTLLYHPPIHTLASHLHLIRMSIRTSLSPTYTHTSITSASHSYVHPHFSITHLYTDQHHICISFVCPSVLLYHPPIHTLASHLHLIRISIHTSLSPTYTQTSITSASHSYVHPYFSITHLYTHQHHICISFVCPSTLLYHPPIHTLASHLHLIRMSIHTSLSPTYTHTSITSASHSYVHPHFSITHLYTHQHHICISFVCPSTLLYHPPIHTLASHLHLIRMSIHTSLSPTYTHTSITSASHSYVHPYFSITHLYTHQHHICISFVCPTTLLYHPPIHTLASHLHRIRMSIHTSLSPTYTHTSLSPTYTHTSITSASHSYVQPHFSITHLYTHQHHICISFVCPSTLLYHPPIHTLASHLHLIHMSIHTSLSPTYTHTSITSASYSYVHPHFSITHLYTHFSITHLYTHQHHICISFICPSTLLYHPPIHTLASHLHLIRMSIHTSLSPTYTHTSITSASHSYVHPYFSITHLYTHQHHICISFVCPSTLLYHPRVQPLAQRLSLIRLSIHNSLSPTICIFHHLYLSPVCLTIFLHHPGVCKPTPPLYLIRLTFHTYSSPISISTRTTVSFIRLTIHNSPSPRYIPYHTIYFYHQYVHPYFFTTQVYTAGTTSISFLCQTVLVHHPGVCKPTPPLSLIRLSIHTSPSPTCIPTHTTYISHLCVHQYHFITHVYTHLSLIGMFIHISASLTYIPTNTTSIYHRLHHTHIYPPIPSLSLICLSIHTSPPPHCIPTHTTSISSQYVHPYFSLIHLYTHPHHLYIISVCPSLLLPHPPIYPPTPHLSLICLTIHTSPSSTYIPTHTTSISHLTNHPYFSLIHLYTHPHHLYLLSI